MNSRWIGMVLGGVMMLIMAVGCVPSSKGSKDSGDDASTPELTDVGNQQDLDSTIPNPQEDGGNTGHDIGPVNPDEDAGGGGIPPNTQYTGCPADSGHTLTGIVRLETLHPTPQATGPNVVVKVPCGREESDPEKRTCGMGSILVWVCLTPDCSGADDPIRQHINSEGSLQQLSFDKEPFEFCGLDSGTYYVLPVIDHDDDGRLSNFDWTMGIKNLADNSVQWPARVRGHQVDVQSDVALGESLVPTNPEASPVVVNYFHYRHPSPVWQSEDAWLFVAATLNPAVVADAVGIRRVDLATHQENDFIASTPEVDARSLGDPDGNRYEGDLEKLAFDGNTAFLSTSTQGVILSVKLLADGTVEQGNSIDLRGLGVDFKQDVAHAGAVLHAHQRRFLAITSRESAGKPLPHQPTYPLMIIDITDLDGGDVTQAVLYSNAQMNDINEVRLDQIIAHNGMLFATETGDNSRARRNDNLNRLWVFTLEAQGHVGEHHIYSAGQYKSGIFEECSSSPPYRQAGLWAGQFNGATHAFVGGLRTLSVFRFDDADDPANGQQVRMGEGFDAYDLPLGSYASGFSLIRANPDGTKLFVFGDCKGRYLAVRGEDWAGGAGSRTQSRRRIAVLDLTSVNSYGLPELYHGYADRTNAPDEVREGLSGANQTLSSEYVEGIGTDCRGILWNLYDVFGYLNVAGNTFGSDCVANRIRDAVVTDRHIYIIGMGSVSNRTTGLGVSSELLILDLESGQEVIHPQWQWFYDGSAYQTRYGYFGMTLGERKDVEVSKGLFLVPKN